jgi:hypothetical protein
MSKSKAKAEKKAYKEKMALHEPVFKLQIMGQDRVMCKYIDIIESRDKLYDEPIELPSQNGVLSFPDQGKYQIIGKACACNIPGGFLLKNKKIPVYYLSLFYASQLVTGSMFNYFLYFTIDEETSKKLILPKDYVNRTMSGKFSLELMDAEGFLSYFIKNKKPIIEKEVVEKFESATDEEINTEIEKRLDVYRNMFKPITIEGLLTRKKIFGKMEEFFKSVLFDEMIKSCLEFTQHQRIEKMGGKTPMTLPKRVLKLKDCLDDPEKINEYVNNLPSDSDSEEYEEYEESYESN